MWETVFVCVCVSHLNVSCRSVALIKLKIVKLNNSALVNPLTDKKLSLQSHNLPSTRAKAQGVGQCLNTE